MQEYYRINVAGLERDLEICPVDEHLSIAAFIIFGDPELTCRCAEELNKLIPEHDILVTSEAKSIPLIHEMARQAGEKHYVIARKSMKVYMHNCFSVTVKSITTANVQQLYIGQTERDLIKGKRVVIVDDVISTGASVEAIEKLVIEAGGNIVAKAAILVEGDASSRPDVISLGSLPIFKK